MTKMIINENLAPVFPCGCDPAICSYKRIWVEAGKPHLIPFDVAIGKKYHPQYTKFLKANYCIQKSYVRSHSEL